MGSVPNEGDSCLRTDPCRERVAVYELPIDQLLGRSLANNGTNDRIPTLEYTESIFV